MIKISASAIRRSFHLLFRGLAVSLIFCLLLALGNGVGRALVQEKAEDFLTLFAEVYTKVLTFYVDEAKSDRLYRGALNGLAESLDPYSTILAGDVLNKWVKRQNGEVACTDFRLRKGSVEPPFVISIPNTSQTVTNGLRAGDYIRKIDGKPTVNMSLGEVMAFLCGPEDSQVSVEIWRRSERRSMELDLTREIPRDTGVSALVVNDVLVIRIPEFRPETPKNLRAILEKSGNKKVLWDLRDNDASTLPQLESAQECLAFLGPTDHAGQLISMNEGQRQETDLLPANNETQPSYSMAVLINPGTSAAAEWFAAVLDLEFDAYLMGKSTFGKTLLQELLPLQESLALWMSSHRISFEKAEFNLRQGLKPEWDLPEELILAKNQALWEAATQAWSDAQTVQKAG